MEPTTTSTRTVLYTTSIKAFELVSYAEATGDTHPHLHGPDAWVSKEGLDASNMLLGMPKIYLQDVLEGRALCVLGVPRDWQMAAFKEIFKNCGQALKCPTIVDLESTGVFRWVIMSSPEEADKVLRDIDGLQLAGNTVRICRALPPGANFVFSEEYPLTEFLKWDLKPPSINIPDGHDNPILPTLPQQPITVVIQPPTPATVRSRPAQQVEDIPRQPPTVLQPTDRPRQTPKLAATNFDDDFVPQAVTWANIVSARGGPVSVELNPKQKPSGIGPRVRSLNRTPRAARKKPNEPLANQMRVVFLLDIPSHVTLTNISDSIKEGSLHSIRFGVDENDGKRYAGIIFQHANEAEIFFKIINKERAESKPNRLSFLANVVRGDAFPADDMIDLMAPPASASRRLTIVKSKFFFTYNESQFRRFCEIVVGADHIQCIWLYNGGNATIVFADVKSAVLVKDELESLRIIAASDVTNHFFGLQVSYSKDPCLQEIHFVTDMRE